MKLIVCGSKKLIEAYQQKLQKYNVELIHSTCDDLDEYSPVIITFPNGLFYSRVQVDRIIDVIKDRADDIKLQTARLYDVEMEKYLSEPVYRKTVMDFYTTIDLIDQWESDVLKKEIKEFISDQKLDKALVYNAIKMALIKTTRAPKLHDMLYAFGKKETKNRLEAYQAYYRQRI